MTEFKVDLQKDGSQWHMTLSGSLNENSELQPIDGSPQKLTIDFKGVGFINSLGIRRWLLWITELNDLEIELQNVTRPVLEQINLVEGFITSKTRVLSIVAPIFCDECDHEETLDLNQGVHYNLQNQKYLGFDKKCPECQTAMELDGKPEKLFRFLNTK